MIEIVAPDYSVTTPKSLIKIFVAGGITDCPDWQREFVNYFKYVGNVVLYNPRREDFDIKNPDISREQIDWEYAKLKEADYIVFWFPEETLCPITLYELGKAVGQNKLIAVGTHPNYKRRFDVVHQVGLAKSTVKVVDSVSELAYCAMIDLGII